MAEQEATFETIKFENAKVLSIKEGTWRPKGTTEDKKKWEIVFQDEANHSLVETAACFQQSLPENVKAEAIIGKLELTKKTQGDRTDVTVKFERPGGRQQGRSFGKSEAELKLMRQDLLFKMYSTHMSYVKDILLAQSAGDFPFDKWYEECKTGLKQILVDLKEIQEGW